MKGGIIIPSTNLITSLLNVTESKIAYSNVWTSNDCVYYEITLVREPMTCPVCGGKMIGHGHKQRTINHPALQDKKGIILYNANRYICKQCKSTTFEQNPFSLQNFNSSLLLIQKTMKYLGNLNYNLQMISEQLNISTTQICKYLDSYITIPPRHLPENLGIDEIHNKYLSKRNSSYLCVLVDNEKRSLYDILDSRNKEHLSLYFSKFSREERCNVKYVTIDMWQPYKEVAKTYFPKAIVAVDPFHVIKHLTDNFQKLRIELMKQCEYDSNQYYLLKKWSWMLVTDTIFWDNEPVYNSRFKRKMNRRDIFNMIKEEFPLLSLAYDLKEEYRKINSESTYEEALLQIPMITNKFKACGIGHYREFTMILCNWQEEIINSFQRPFGNRRLSNALTENINGKIRTYLTVSNGVSNFARFRKRVIYALSPEIYYSITSSLTSEKRSCKKRGHYKKKEE